MPVAEKRGVGGVSGHQDGRAVFGPQAEDLRATVRHDLEPIAQRIDQQVSRRNRSVTLARAHDLGVRIGDAINLFPRGPVVPAIVHNPAAFRVSAGELHRMAGTRRGDAVAMVAIREPCPVATAAVDNAVRIEPGPKSFEILIRELIDADDNNQSGRIVRRESVAVGNELAETQDKNARKQRVELHEIPYGHRSLRISFAAGPCVGRTRGWSNL